jgi:membrane associated rhomboid family serine protease
MIPLSDDLPTLRAPWMTWVILGLMFAVWLLVERAGVDPLALATTVCNYGLVPGELTHRAPLGQAVPIGQGVACVVDNYAINYLTPITSLFIHGGWGHILGNALFFWVFGNNVEDSMGHGRFAVFYLLCGLAAAAAQIAVNPASPVPTVGASGAISGVMGAYLVLYPRARVNMLFIFVIFFKVIPVPAWLVLLWWFALQVLTGLPELMQVNPEISGGVAVWAHVGGFLAGVLLIRLFADSRMVQAHRALHGSRYGRASWR